MDSCVVSLLAAYSAHAMVFASAGWTVASTAERLESRQVSWKVGEWGCGTVASLVLPVVVSMAAWKVA